jgi:2'-5' RNA ligase
MPERLFVALWPDAAARTALAESLGHVRAGLPEIRWQPPERWHLTLAFLGLVDRSRAEQRLAGIDPPRAEAISLRGAGCFGPTVWMGVAHGPWLGDLAGTLQRALRTADRRFRAHLTVGRARGPHAPARARQARAALVDHEGPPWLPGAITLVASANGPRPRYTVMASWPLASAPAPPERSS